MDNHHLLEKIDAAVAAKHLLKHPFYREWQAGKLTRESLRLYAAQYYRHVEAFPRHLRVLAERADARLRAIVSENLAEEENPAAPHPQLWRDFAAALGVNHQNIVASRPLPATQAVVSKFGEICADRPLTEAVAALYAYESQVPEIATTKIDGLRTFYGIDHPRALAYFTVHEEADKAHRAAWRGWLASHAQGDEETVLATTNEALNALWGALDGVHSVKN
jgi:pyrroloquinoline-quinone synthase